MKAVEDSCGKNQSVFFSLRHVKRNFFKNFFNWEIIALQYRVGFSHMSTWISHIYACMYVCMYVCIYAHIGPLPLETASHLPPHPTSLGCHIALGWVPCSTQQTPTIYFTYGNIHVSMLLSQLGFPSEWRKHKLGDLA